MKATCDVVIEYETEEKARVILQAIEVDNMDFVTCTLQKRELHAHIESKSVSSLLHTLDDYLACVTVADRVVDKN
jgi:tRNA threonylcarbamoyladenosine modification (KEOPS) complex  Pcc1 subunit